MLALVISLWKLRKRSVTGVLHVGSSALSYSGPWSWNRPAHSILLSFDAARAGWARERADETKRENVTVSRNMVIKTREKRLNKIDLRYCLTHICSSERTG